MLQAGIPVPVTYNGMPNARYWAFEDGQTNFGDVSASTTDLATLLFCEFALVYGNDWFLLPCDLPLGSLAHVRGLRVTTVFGESFWIEPAGADAGLAAAVLALHARPHRRMAPRRGGRARAAADLAGRAAGRAARAGRAHPRRDGEHGLGRRAAWCRSPTVGGVRGVEAARETRAAYQRLLAGTAPPAAPPPAAPIRYQAMTSVPENWIPFVPAHVDGDNRETQLQRAAMPRLLDGDPNPPVPVRPRTSLLRQGLDASPPAPYLVHAEEVPRAGTQVEQGYRRARWRDGRAVVWFGRGAQSGAARDRAGWRSTGWRRATRSDPHALTPLVASRHDLTAHLVSACATLMLDVQDDGCDQRAERAYGIAV